MRRPRRWRAIALAALPLGALLAHAASRVQAELATVVLVTCAVSSVLFALVVGWRAHRAARAQARLAAGEGALARWQVDAGTWQAFVARERQRAGIADTLPNEASLPPAPPGGMAVIVGEDAICIGDSVHLLPRHGVPEVLDAGLHDAGDDGVHVAELRLRYPPTMRRTGSMTPPLYTRLTFPLPQSAWRDARAAIGFYSLGRPGKAGFMHGRGDGSDPEDLSTCGKCGYGTHAYRATCPRCGGGMLSRRWARRFGAALIVLGSLLAVGMTVLLVKLSPMLARPGLEQGGMRFSGTPAQALMVWGVLAAVLVFGATTLVAGITQVATGKRNMRFAYFAMVLFGGLVVAGRLLAGD